VTKAGGRTPHAGEAPLPFDSSPAEPALFVPPPAGRPRAAKPFDPATHMHGHRERLRERLFLGGPDALHDHELLESALFLAFPRGDTKPLAKALLHEFGDLAGVLAASPEELKRVKGVGDVVAGGIKTIQAISVRALRRQAMRGPVLSGMDRVLDYLHLDKAGLGAEQFRVLFLNNRNRLLRDEVMWEGTVNQAPAYPREIVKRALELGATALILVHNHPSGDPAPSRDDIRLTKAIEAAASAHDIAVHDHLVIGREGHASLRALGHL
jgi:DNA repair protein RadC